MESIFNDSLSLPGSNSSSSSPPTLRLLALRSDRFPLLNAEQSSSDGLPALPGVKEPLVKQVVTGCHWMLTSAWEVASEWHFCPVLRDVDFGTHSTQRLLSYFMLFVSILSISMLHAYRCTTSQRDLPETITSQP